MLVVGSVVSSDVLVFHFFHKCFFIGFMNVFLRGTQVPHGPAHTYLEPGDVLVRLNGKVVN